MPPLTDRRRPPSLLDVTLLALLVLAYNWPVVGQGRVFFDRDLDGFVAGRFLSFREALRSGAWPVWNPLPAFGEPLLAIANIQLAYPTTWLVLWLAPGTTITVAVVLQTWLTALGARALALELGASRVGAALCGAVWALGGPFQSGGNQLNVLAGATWLPWAWYAFARAGRTGRFHDALGAGLAVAACVIGGSPESAVMSLLGSFLALSGDGLSLARRATRFVRALGIAAVFGAAVSAVQWVPTAVLASRSTRPDAPVALRDEWSTHPGALAQLALPLDFENLPLKPPIRKLLFEGREPLLYSIYLGLPVLGLTAAGLLAPTRGRHLLTGLALFFVLLALGRFGPVWPWTQGLPLVGWMRFPARFVIAGTLPMAVLAGFGVDAVAGRSPGHRIRWAMAGVTCAILAAFTASLADPAAPLWGLSLDSPAEFGPWLASPSLAATFRGCAIAALLALPVTAACLWRGLARSPAAGLGLVASLCALCAVLELSRTTRRLNPTVPRALLARQTPALSRIPATRPNRTLVLSYPGELSQRLLGRDAPQHHLHDIGPEQKLSVARYYPLNGLAGSGWPIESVPGDVPALRERQVARWINSVQGLAATPAFPRLVELSGIQYVLALHELEANDGFEIVSVAQGLFAPVRTYRVRAPLPRALVASGATLARGQAAFDALLAPGFDPRRAVVLEEGDEAPAGEPGRVLALDLGFDRVRIEVEASSPAHVVLLEAWDPGWRATVDGVATPVRRANLAFRAVPVPPGRHVVEMRYRPPELAIGVALSCAGVLVAGLAAARGRRPA